MKKISILGIMASTFFSVVAYSAHFTATPMKAQETLAPEVQTNACEASTVPVQLSLIQEKKSCSEAAEVALQCLNFAALGTGPESNSIDLQKFAFTDFFKATAKVCGLSAEEQAVRLASCPINDIDDPSMQSHFKCGVLTILKLNYRMHSK